MLIAFRIHIFADTNFFRYSTFTNRTRVLSLKPCRDAFCMEAMQAWQYNVLLLDLIAKLADGTLFVLFAEIRRVGLRKLTFWQHFYHGARHWIYYVFVKLQELFILFRVLPVT